VAQLLLVAVSNAACRGGWLNVPVPSLGHVDRAGWAAWVRPAVVKVAYW